MAWSKMKQNLESYLASAVSGRVEYSATGYRYLPDTIGRCYIRADKMNLFNMRDGSTSIKWYQSEQEIRNDPAIEIPVDQADIEAVRSETKGTVPEDRLMVIAGNRKKSEYAKSLFSAQSKLAKSDFNSIATKFLSSSIEDSLSSDDILLNVLALIDRRVGKKRLLNMNGEIKLKHPIVQYFYRLRISSM